MKRIEEEISPYIKKYKKNNENFYKIELKLTKEELFLYEKKSEYANMDITDYVVNVALNQEEDTVFLPIIKKEDIPLPLKPRNKKERYLEIIANEDEYEYIKKIANNSILPITEYIKQSVLFDKTISNIQNRIILEEYRKKHHIKTKRKKEKRKKDEYVSPWEEIASEYNKLRREEHNAKFV